MTRAGGENAVTKFGIAVCASFLLAYTSGASGAQKRTAIEEVIVTAQKREASLQDTPIALTAFDEDALAREGIANVGDLANSIPSLTIQPFPINTTTLRIYIRGIGLIDAQLTQDPPVGVYIDGAYIARSSALATDIADLTRIEVLRGPQGTLYGRNSTGGAVNLVTRRPHTEELEFKQHLTIGDRNLLRVKSMLNVPVTEKVAAKFAFYHTQVDGYIENTGQGGDFGDRDINGYRVDLRWTPIESVTLDYAWDRSDVENTNLAYSPVLPSLPIDDPNLAFTDLINAGARQFFDYNTDGKRPDKLHSPVPIPAAENLIQGHQFTADWSFSESASAKYIYAQRELFDQTPTNLGTGARSDGYRLDNEALLSFPIPSETGGLDFCTPCVGRTVLYPGYQPTVEHEQYTHELQLLGEAFEGRISYIAGLYYFKEQASERSGKNAEMGHLLSGPLGSDEAGNNTGNRIEVLLQYGSEIENRAAAAFLHATWRLPILEDRLSITLGARHSRDNRKVFGSGRQVSFVVQPGDADNTDRDVNDIGSILEDVAGDNFGSIDYKDDSFSFIVEYDAAEDINLYLKRDEAYKSGGFNSREPQDEAGRARFRRGFDREKVIAWELGIKARGFDNRLQINADVFYQEFIGQQLNFAVPDTLNNTTVANSDGSILKGFELDTTLVVFDGLVWVLNYAYLDAEIAPSMNPITQDVEDNFVFDSAPQHSWLMAVDWTFGVLDAGGYLSANLTWSFTDERSGGATKKFDSFQFDRQDDFKILNLRVGMYEQPWVGGMLNVSLWAKNLLDEEYSLNNVHTYPHASRAVLFAEPRSFGVDVAYSFGG